MGNTFGKKKQNKKCLMFGLRDSGKTTILNKLKLWEVSPTVSTIGFNHEFIGYEGCNLDIYDIG